MKRLLSIVGLVLVSLLVVKASYAECPPDPWNFAWNLSSTAYVNGSGDVWLELTPNHTDNSGHCKSECLANDVVIIPGTLAFNVRRGGPQGNGTFTAGANWTVVASGGGGPYPECVGGYVLSNGLEPNSNGYQDVQKVFDTMESQTIYLGRATNGTLVDLACSSASVCEWVDGGCWVNWGEALRSITWFARIVRVTGPPTACHPECNQLDKTTGPDTPIKQRPWNSIKGLYR